MKLHNKSVCNNLQRIVNDALSLFCVIVLVWEFRWHDPLVVTRDAEMCGHHPRARRGSLGLTGMHPTLSQ